jgi:HK97 family phage prohead protease
MMKTIRIVRPNLKLAIMAATAAMVQPPIADKVPQPQLVGGKRVLRFDGAIDLEQADHKKFDTVKEGDKIVDYQNVVLKGYLSTFKDHTPSDRDGDYVLPGAFAETIPNFMKNPVLLVNHRNTVQDLAGGFTKVVEDSKGLYVEAKITNSPAEWARDVRFKVAEGFLRTMSMGGIFYYKEDQHGIFKVSLWEGSLTPIPANPDAVFSTRQLDEREVKKVQSELAA